MRIPTPPDLGAQIGDRRITLLLGQKSLAAKVGVSRQRIVEVEEGRPRAEVGLLRRTVEALVCCGTRKKEMTKELIAIP